MDREYRAIELTEHGSFKSYLLGFVLSLIFTFAAFFIIYSELLPTPASQYTISFLAIAQSWVLLALFLHLGKESKPRWNLLIFLFMVLVTVIVVFGSLWIMHHLSYNLMPPMDHS